MSQQLLLVAGVRPQYVKASAFVDAWRTYSRQSGISPVVFDTGQHYDNGLAAEEVLGMKLPTVERLDHRDKDPLSILGRSITEIGHYAKDQRNGVVGVIVFGDANPALAGALAASKSVLPLVHVEAGARRAWYEQEERNRRVIDEVADLNLCVTERALEVLDDEEVRAECLHVGDLAIDQFRDIVSKLDLEGRDDEASKVLVTLHRPFNIDGEFIANLVRGLEDLGLRSEWLCHPRAKPLVEGAFAGLKPSLMEIVAPMPHNNLLSTIRSSRFVISDSGGVIRESHLLARRVLVAREIGGWKELIDIGANAYLGKTMSEMHEALRWMEYSWNDEKAYKSNFLNPSPLAPKDGVKRAIKAIDRLLENSGRS